jgi:uncharacterized membrane protein YagU involved in acid resistance
MAYGTLWWLLGALTLLPWLRGESVRWSLAGAQEAFPSLVGHLAYGATAGAVLAVLGAAAGAMRPGRGALVRGALAGALAGVAFAGALSAAGRLDEAGLDGASAALRWVLALVLGAVAGAVYGALYPRPRGALGPGLVRGLSFGFLLWLALALTLVPLLAGDGLPWELGAARERAVALVPALLAGVLLVVVYRALGVLTGAGLADDPAELADEGVGTRALQGLGRGTLGGLAGGVLFTFVLAQVDGLERIAGLAGGGSPLLGLAVHLLIAIVLGMSYGVLFRHEGGEPEAALGWGVSYGVLWWLLGNLTCCPSCSASPPAGARAPWRRAFRPSSATSPTGPGSRLCSLRSSAARGRGGRPRPPRAPAGPSCGGCAPRTRRPACGPWCACCWSACSSSQGRRREPWPASPDQQPDTKEHTMSTKVTPSASRIDAFEETGQPLERC